VWLAAPALSSRRLPCFMGAQRCRKLKRIMLRGRRRYASTCQRSGRWPARTQRGWCGDLTETRQSNGTRGRRAIADGTGRERSVHFVCQVWRRPPAPSEDEIRGYEASRPASPCPPVQLMQIFVQRGRVRQGSRGGA
jgi:hypothetical protein